MGSTRRQFISGSLLGTAGIAAGMGASLFAAGTDSLGMISSGYPSGNSDELFSISIFSKCLHWLGYEEMAQSLAAMGYDGIDLTVRPDGHVSPERVEEDLPAAVRAAKSAGLQVPMITTAITDVEDPLTDRILKTAAVLGIRHYRMGWYYFDKNRPVEESLKTAELKLRQLAALNQQYAISGEYQNHSGAGENGIYLGGAIWDIAALLWKINSEWLNAQYDIYHAMVEGANTWPAGLDYIAPYIRTLDIKDFQYIRKNEVWTHESVPLGKGTVDYPKFLSLIKQYGIRCPLSLHFEYPLGGAEAGARTVTMKREDIFAALSADLKTLKTWLKNAGLV
jgi:L-ribulose-5-phosphate 3-epimerase